MSTCVASIKLTELEETSTVGANIYTGEECTGSTLNTDTTLACDSCSGWTILSGGIAIEVSCPCKFLGFPCDQLAMVCVGVCCVVGFGWTKYQKNRRREQALIVHLAPRVAYAGGEVLEPLQTNVPQTAAAMYTCNVCSATVQTNGLCDRCNQKMLSGRLLRSTHVRWIKADNDVPAGSIGQVLGYGKRSGKCIVKFPKGTFAFKDEELEPLQTNVPQTAAAVYGWPEAAPPTMRGASIKVKLKSSGASVSPNVEGYNDRVYPVTAVAADPISTLDQRPIIQHVAASSDALHYILAQAKLEKYEPAIEQEGCVEAADLQAMEDDELRALGMKNAEIKRLHRWMSKSHRSTQQQHRRISSDPWAQIDNYGSTPLSVSVDARSEEGDCLKSDSALYCVAFWSSCPGQLLWTACSFLLVLLLWGVVFGGALFFYHLMHPLVYTPIFG